MSADLAKLLTSLLGSRARFNQPMSAHTTWGVGGPAWCVARVHGADEASRVCRAASDAGKPWMVLGRGSNLLVSDHGYDGVMLRLNGPLGGIKRHGQGLACGAGAPLTAAVRLASRLGLAGLEWAAGIPGTVGGAVRMNAGAMGGDMARVTRRFELLLADGELTTASRDDYPAAYRYRALPARSVVITAELSLTPAAPELVERRADEALAKRHESQPGGMSAGSVFKNPPGDAAGRLIEEAGCKGLSRGAAQVSHKHANFIINRGGASARDVLALMREVAARVKDAHGVELEPEVEVVGV